MSEPFIFITTHTINDGELEAIKELSQAYTELVESADTGLVAFHFHLSEDEKEVSLVQVHADAASMDAYLPLARTKIAEALELSETTSIDAYGTPGPIVSEVVRQFKELGVRVRVMPHHLNGFTRGPAS